MSTKKLGTISSIPQLVKQADIAIALADMDAAAKQAEIVLRKLPRAHIETVCRFWMGNYMKAGHKRLGRILIKLAKENNWK